MRLDIDIGSTTVKFILLGNEGEVLYSVYERHMSNVFEKVAELLKRLYDEFGDISIKTVITGSGGLAISENLSIPFEQEVIACSSAVEKLIPETDVAIELGGEDAKITFYDQSIEQRMNGTCAGGTGASRYPIGRCLLGAAERVGGGRRCAVPGLAVPGCVGVCRARGISKTCGSSRVAAFERPASPLSPLGDFLPEVGDDIA